MIKYKICDSTNNIAKKLANSGAPHLTVVSADNQTKARGRLSRSWFTANTPDSSSLACSIIIRPHIHISRAFQINLLTSCAILDFCHQLQIPAKIKWPNDIYINNKKLAGILTEITDFDSRNSIIRSAVVGIGLNIKLDKSNMPREIRNIATDLSSYPSSCITNRSRDAGSADSAGSTTDIKIQLITQIQNYLNQIKSDTNPNSRLIKSCFEKAHTHSLILNKKIGLNGPILTKKPTATAIGFDKQYNLIIRTLDPKPQVKIVTAGDVGLKRN